MGATIRLALLGVRRRSLGQVVALVLVTALAAAAIVTGLAARRSATDLLDQAYQRAGRPDLVLLGDGDALRRAAGDDAVAAAASDPAPVASLMTDVGGEPVDVRLTAVDPASLPAVARPDLVEGRWPAAGAREVVVERSAAGTATIGQQLKVDGPAGPVELEVVGSAIDLSGCFRPLCDPLRLLGLVDLVTRLAGGTPGEHVVALRLADPATARAVESRLLAADPGGLRDASAWPDARDEILEGPQIIGAFAAGFGVFLMAVACLVVAGATTARLVSRRRAFGLLKAVGYRPGQLTNATLAEHLAIGAAGVVAGWAAGSLLAPAVRVLGGAPDAAGYVVREGRPASGPGEAMVGYGFLARTGRHVGDVIDLRVGGATVRLTVVGWFSELAEGGEIVQVHQDALPASAVIDQAPTFRLVAASGVEPSAMAAAVAARLGDRATVIAPDLDDGGRTEGIALFAVLTVVLGGIASANLLAVTVAGQRERARSLGILRAVGCTTRQLIGQSAVGTAAIGLIAGVVGAPLGWLLFRVAAHALTKAAGLGPNPVPAPSWAALAAVIIGITVTAAGTGALAAVGPTRRPAADLVRYE